MVDRSILQCEYIRYTQQTRLGANRAIGQLYIDIPTEDLVLSLKVSYLELEIDILAEMDDETSLAADIVRLVNLGSSAFFSEYKSSSSSGKEFEFIVHAHIACLPYKILTSPRS